MGPRRGGVAPAALRGAPGVAGQTAVVVRVRPQARSASPLSQGRHSASALVQCDPRGSGAPAGQKQSRPSQRRSVAARAEQQTRRRRHRCRGSQRAHGPRRPVTRAAQRGRAPRAQGTMCRSPGTQGGWVTKRLGASLGRTLRVQEGLHSQPAADPQAVAAGCACPADGRMPPRACVAWRRMAGAFRLHGHAPSAPARPPQPPCPPFTGGPNAASSSPLTHQRKGKQVEAVFDQDGPQQPLVRGRAKAPV